MKKVLTALLFFTICLTMISCSDRQTTKSDATTASTAASAASTASIAVSSASPIETEEPEYDGINPEDSDAGVDFSVDQSLLEPQPEGAISVYEAQKLIVDTITPEYSYSPPENCYLLYIYRGMIDIEGNDFYHIEFGASDDTDFTLERSFAVSLSGELYEGVPHTDAFAPYELYTAHAGERGEDTDITTGSEK